MKIRDLRVAAGLTGFFFDDQRAIKQGAAHDGFTYTGAPATDGFTAIRQAGESLSILILLEDGQIACGDAAAVQYSGAGGRDPLFLAGNYRELLETQIRPHWLGMELDHFLDAARWVDNLRIDGKRLHTALRYGLSQALLDAHAKAHHEQMVETLCREFALPVLTEPVAIFGQSGDDRYNAADKMILKRADVLPHALINNIDKKLGRTGEILRDYIRWLSQRIRQLRADDSYQPQIHIDVYGNIGTIFADQIDRIADYLAALGADAEPFPLYIEGPVDCNAREPQIEMLAEIRDRLSRIGSPVKIVADEWCNTLEDIQAFTDARCCHMVQIKTPDLGSIHNIVESILYCKAHGMESYQGGTCNETDISARTCVHVALAARAERLLAKPGMGFDEGYMIVHNEMARTLELLRAKNGEPSS